MRKEIKIKTIVIAIIAMLISGTALQFNAYAAGPYGIGRMAGRQYCNNCDRYFVKWAQALNLTDSQNSQIQAIIQTERQNNALLYQQIETNRQQIQQLMQSGAPDEAAVKNILAGENDARAELIVSHARMWSQIQALLTPDQQALAQKLRQISRPRCWQH